MTQRLDGKTIVVGLSGGIAVLQGGGAGARLLRTAARACA